MNKIEFFTNNKKLLSFPELLPQPARNFIPDWYKKTPVDDKNINDYVAKLIPSGRTVKTCPSFMEIFNEGFVLVAPCDIWIRVEEDGTWQWKTAYADFQIEEHGDRQMVNHLPEKNIKKILKFVSPWYAKTPKGYSVRQIPMVYHYKQMKDWHIPYGVIKTDQHYFLNNQICITSDNNEILIKRGDPLNYLIPYKREKFTLKIGDFNKHTKDIDKQHMEFTSQFRSRYHKYN